MSIRIYWKPPQTPVVTFDVMRADAADGPFFLMATLEASSDNFDVASSRYYYDDVDGTDAHFYRVQGFSSQGYEVARSPVFQPAVVKGAELGTRVKVDHHYGGTDALRYLAPGGAGIAGATIRIYRDADYQAGRTANALAVTQTDDAGRWVAPVLLEPGLSYVVHFAKDDAFGPDTVTIVV